MNVAKSAAEARTDRGTVWWNQRSGNDSIASRSCFCLAMTKLGVAPHPPWFTCNAEGSSLNRDFSALLPKGKFRKRERMCSRLQHLEAAGRGDQRPGLGAADAAPPRTLEPRSDATSETTGEAWRRGGPSPMPRHDQDFSPCQQSPPPRPAASAHFVSHEGVRRRRVRRVPRPPCHLLHTHTAPARVSRRCVTARDPALVPCARGRDRERL